MKTNKVNKIPTVKETNYVLFFGEIFKDQQRSHRLANKYFVLSLQSEPSADQGHFKFLILATYIRWKTNNPLVQPLTHT